jgi:predicted Fe-Mo cluster-binding NifX family protein
MRIAISADNSAELDSIVSPHFGRCPYYLFVTLDGDQVQGLQAVENPYYGRHEPGQVPHFIHSQGADVMLSGGMGRRAITFFQQYGIQAVTGASGTVRHALAQYLSGMLQGAAPCAESTAHAHEEHPTATPYERDEVGRMREEVELLQNQLDAARARLDRLQGG